MAKKTETKAKETNKNNEKKPVNEAKEKSATKKGKEKPDPTKALKEEISKLKEELADSKDKYIRLSAEFDNYRKRTLKEKSELVKSAGEEIFLKILPVMDDFERAMVSIEDPKSIEHMADGVKLIHNKFREFFNQNNIKEIPAKEKDFDTDLHEAVTKIPAPDKKLKGKVVDVIEKGYTLNDRVIRFAKVVIGE